MKVILIKDVKNFGKKHDIKEVSDGYGRNLLIKKGLAKIATPKDILLVEKEIEKEKEKIAKQNEILQEVAKKIDGSSFEIAVKVGKKEELFEAVSVQKIVEEVNKKGFEINKEQVETKEPIKELGEHIVKLIFKNNIKAEVKIKVIKEK
jgi:large subunit ribosomal protein L9